MYAAVGAALAVLGIALLATPYMASDTDTRGGDGQQPTSSSSPSSPSSSSQPVTQQSSTGDSDSEEGAPTRDTVGAGDGSMDGSAFCSSGGAQSTAYVREFDIPTQCSGPVAITTVDDSDGSYTVWFAQTTTGKLVEFDPATDTFTEHYNPRWPADTGVERSMIWGMDHSPDGHIWFTDEVFDSVWRYSISDGTYDRFDYPSDGRSLPQRLLFDEQQSVIIINDFTGNKLTFLDPPSTSPDDGGSDDGKGEQGISYFSIPSPAEGSVTAGFAVDPGDTNNGDVWFTNWVHWQGGVLVKFDKGWYQESVIKSGMRALPLLDFVDVYPMPPELLTPNGIEVGQDGIVWLADTSSSSFFSFDPGTQEFVQYTTVGPQPDTYGNHTGIVKSPISRPYWIDAGEGGRLVINAHASNNIAVVDPASQTITEYHIPSKNPAWGDCAPAHLDDTGDCGLAQIFGMTVRGHEVWFTEWVENKLGVVDTSVPPPAIIGTGTDSVVLEPGASQQVLLTIEYTEEVPDGAYLILSAPHESLDVKLVSEDRQGAMSSAMVEISARSPAADGEEGLGGATPGTYKVLLGIQTPNIAVGKFVTVIVP